MSHYHYVGLWITQAQYNENEFEVRDKADTYIQSESTSDDPARLWGYTKSEVYSAPTEDPHESFDAKYPCDRTFTITYDNLLDWWDDMVECEDLSTESDSNILITDNDGYCGGGLAWVYGTTCVANGNNIENLPDSYVDYEHGCGAYSMATVMQEIGHNVMDGPSDSDGDGEGQHDTGATVYHSDGRAVTPMSAGYWDDLEGDNECGESYPDPDDGYYEFRYSDCARSYFQPK